MSWWHKPILFLDIDGVLNSIAYARRKEKGGESGPLGIDPEAVVHLQRIVDEADCAMVLSSTWRLGMPLAEMRSRLIDAGMRPPVPLRDKTPDLSNVIFSPQGQRVGAIVRRGEEVKRWIDSKGFTGRYCCIDDDADFLPGQPLVQTSFKKGITAAHADRVIAILRGT